MANLSTQTRNIFWTIVGFVFIAVIINLPETIPVKIHFQKINWEHTFYRPNLNFKLGPLNFSQKYDLKYGLDLAGGASLLFEVDTSKVPADSISSATESLKTNIERRVNLFGISEANVQLSRENERYRLIVELPGITQLDQAVSLIGKTAQLTFRGETEIAPEATASATFADVFSEDTGINGSHLVISQVQINPNTGKPEVGLEFNQEGSQLFAAATKKFLNKRIGIFLDDMPISIPFVETEIPDGRAVINGSFDLPSAKALSAQINAGALPLPIRLVQQTYIGPTLGKDAIDKGVKAGLVGLFLVCLFMIANYGKLGLIADVSLLIYGLTTLTLYRLIPVTLTFSGVVGFILSVGMAVDSNILIFERLREEIRRGRGWNNAMELGFGRAWDAIKDANACTIITGFILFNPFNWSFLNSSGMVRGFAVTLILGIVVSVFTGVVVTRNLLRVFAREKLTVLATPKHP
ncbi:MAG: protein translocase subunit SecD [Candidatus Shapirobacteria bacterium]|jgi:preprotein translocase subunit SecD